jgi:hypothetical protein
VKERITDITRSDSANNLHNAALFLHPRAAPFVHALLIRVLCSFAYSLSFLSKPDRAGIISFRYNSLKVDITTSEVSSRILIMPSSTREEDDFQSLVRALSDKLGPCSGIDSDDVDENELQQLMKDYVSNESEWEKYYFPSSKMSYTRNLVDKGNGKSNLVCYTRRNAADGRR